MAVMKRPFISVFSIEVKIIFRITEIYLVVLQKFFLQRIQ